MRFLLQPKRISSFLLIPLLITGVLSIQGCGFTGIPAIDVPTAVGMVALGGTAEGYGRSANHKQCDIYKSLFLGKAYKWNIQRHLRQGERILVHENLSQEGIKGFIVITDERLIYYDTYSVLNVGQWCVDVELTSIQSIEEIDCKAVGCASLNLYGGGSIPVNNVSWPDINIINLIQVQVDYINSIRDDLGIDIPANVSQTGLDRLNEPVIAELRKQRKTN